MARGWVVHTVTNPWGYGAGSTGWGIRDRRYLDSLQNGAHLPVMSSRVTVLPVLREAAEFSRHIVPEQSTAGVTGPSDSPENWHIAPRAATAEGMGTPATACVYALHYVQDAQKRQYRRSTGQS